MNYLFIIPIMFLAISLIGIGMLIEIGLREKEDREKEKRRRKDIKFKKRMKRLGIPGEALPSIYATEGTEGRYLNGSNSF